MPFLWSKLSNDINSLREDPVFPALVSPTENGKKEEKKRKKASPRAEDAIRALKQ